MAGGAADGAAGTATVTKAVADAGAPALPVYQQRDNRPLQDLPARMRPPPPGTPASYASTESFHTARSTPGSGPAVPVPPLTSQPVQDFGPPSRRAAQESGHAPVPGASRTHGGPRPHRPGRQEGGSGRSM
ncbi:hypothetical protein OH738_18650 [Streptomyces hirsutus]|uniref:Serine/threonine protein kinase n=1 Tax=Streptomyces hirsutus TaxID=35620 RepID=A0ABZ1GRP5_9ACTN|nr:hypothetical protein [Streptomyces hirsutus]WSD07941.1 hypothetical protein OIE73_20845 [Streptomyces hirsutus]WTD18614.1 hypothetical protein OH738_18650 [Streptomyces hirsutus]